MSEIINLLAEEEKFIQAMTTLLSFGVIKYIVIPLLQDLNDWRKEYFNNLLLLLPFLINQHLLPQRYLHRQLEMILVQSHQPTLGKCKFF
jgi:hypothetical protein